MSATPLQLSESQKEIMAAKFKANGFKSFNGTHFEVEGRYKNKSFAKCLEYLQFPSDFKDIPEIRSEVLAINAEDEKTKFDIIVPILKRISLDFHRSQEKDIYLPIPKDNEGEGGPSSNQDYLERLRPVIGMNRNSGRMIYLLDPENNNRPCLEVDEDVYLARMGLSSAAVLADPKVPPVYTEFDPYSTGSTLNFKYHRESGERALHLNLYSHPYWRTVKRVEGKYTGFFKRLMEHLFPEDAEREYVLDWMHHSLTGRCQTVLLLVGARGTGKTVLVSDVMANLVGVNYFEKGNQAVLEEKFNAQFKDKRLIFFDEVKILEDEHVNSLKSFSNDRIPVEGKGRDPETVANFVSVAVANNNRNCVRIEPQDRRFSAPRVTDVVLKKVIPESEIDAFVRDINRPDSDTLAEIGWFLMERKPKTSPMLPLKGRYYFELCQLSMPEWKSYILSYIRREGEIGVPITSKELAKGFRKVYGDALKFGTKAGTVQAFLMDYLHEAQFRIGRVLDREMTGATGNQYEIMPDEEFLRSFGDNYINREESGAEGL